MALYQTYLSFLSQNSPSLKRNQSSPVNASAILDAVSVNILFCLCSPALWFLIIFLFLDPTGFIALIRPLVDAGLIAPDAPLTVNAVSGYSGGGKGLIEIYESDNHEPWGAYGYSMNHKHIPEMAKYTGLKMKPIFQPAVATFAQGMVVSVPFTTLFLKLVLREKISTML
eukprot:CCRYP_016009-RA/>CCRYP_016009-RA protein AED:0.24 eAED:0.24 QI:58/1/1/1/1/1/2/359/169